MNFNRHSNLVGLHSFLSASKYHWVNYDVDKLDRVYTLNMAAQRGTELHALAAEAIRLGVKFAGNRQTLSMYVNDALGFRMAPEQPLYVSDNCFGTPDAISFRRNKLRVHDLKNGKTQTSETQLKVYAAMFCIEYDYNPHEIAIELRIYQNDMIRIYTTDPDSIVMKDNILLEVLDPHDIRQIMETILIFDKRINALREEAMS